MTAEWLQAITALVGVVLATLLACLAWRQYRLERHGLRLDLFDRRWVVYKAAYDFICSLSQNPDRIGEAFMGYSRKTQQARFLFDQDVERYFADLRNRALEMKAARTTLKGSDDSSEKTRANSKYHELQRGFIGELDRLATALDPFLSFREFRKRSWFGKRS